MKPFYLYFISCLLINTLSAQAVLSGDITDAQTNEDLIGTNITFYQEGIYKDGTVSDFDGVFSAHLAPGVYDVEVSYVGYETNRTTEIEVLAGQDNILDLELKPGVNLPEVVILAYKVPLINGCGTWCVWDQTEELTEIDVEIKEQELPEINKPSVHYYPNPTINTLFVVLGNDFDQLIIRSINGQEVNRTGPLSTGTTEINVSDLAAGTYLIQVIKGKQFVTEKFIIVRP